MGRGRQRGRIFFEGLYYQSSSDCTRPEAVIELGAGGGRPLPLRASGGITHGDFFYFLVPVCAFFSADRAHFSKKGVLRNAQI